MLQQRQLKERDEVMQQLKKEVDMDAKQSSSEQSSNKTILFQCTVKRIPLKFDGHKCLTGVNVGDVVDVLEEGVGPGGMYNLCSVNGKEGENNVGWYPCSCLEVVKK